MMVVVSYDVSTVDAAGRKRLRWVAKVCTNYGQRVQNSVFQCLVDPQEWVSLRGRLLRIFDPKKDSLRFYFLGANWKKRVEHHGTKKVVDPDEPLIV